MTGMAGIMSQGKDATTRMLPSDLSAGKLYALLSPDGGEKFDWDEYYGQ